ncbi:hypothetical protein HAX54_001277, partial [Datura stramonium]|nr:hypothetical protein [Datura stramonium]
GGLAITGWVTGLLTLATTEEGVFKDISRGKLDEATAPYNPSGSTTVALDDAPS